jgi:signal transduction histidine kinase
MQRAMRSEVLAILATPRDADIAVDDEIIAALDGDVLDDGAALLAPRLSSASRRLRALAALSGSLTDALSPDDAANIVERDALVALDANSAVVVTRGAFPPTVEQPLGESAPSSRLHVVHAIGLSDAVLATVRGAAIESPIPLAVVARLGEAMYISTPEALGEHGAWGDAMLAGGAQSAAIVPVWANGELRGVLGLGCGTRHVFGEDDRAFVSTLGVMCAQALMRAHLRAAERAAREEAQEARLVAERANASKALFLRTISHELRTPINAAMNYAELLSKDLETSASPQQRVQIEQMQASNAHLLGLVDELLGFSRLEAGQVVIRPESVQLGAVIEHGLALVQPIAVARGVTLRMQGDVPDVEIFTDPQKLRQVLVNLMASAVKYTAAEGSVVLMMHLEGLGDVVSMEIQVTDTGRGITPADQQHIFEPFWQGLPEDMPQDGSTGLGLSVARQLARLLGGDVRLARTEAGVGGSFIITLPVRYTGAAAHP